MTENAPFAVSVAMATYNGARFIGPQLASLANQSLLPAELFVSDDGSSDATLDIVRHFAATAPFPVLVHRNERRLHFADNFLFAARSTHAGWIAFCDQDDEWHPDKLRIVANSVAGRNDILLVTHPSRVIRDGTLTDERVGPTNGGMAPPLTQHPFLVHNGHSLVLRRALLDVLPLDQRPANPHDPDHQMPHDDWISFLASALGCTRILPDALVCYRLHPGNVSDAFRRRTGAIDQLRRGRSLDRSDIEKHHLAAVNRAAQMQRLAGTPGPLQPNAARAVIYYDRVAALLARRVSLWRTPSRLRRAVLAADLLRRGAYGAFAKGGMGQREMLKDALVGVLKSGSTVRPAE